MTLGLFDWWETNQVGIKTGLLLPLNLLVGEGNFARWRGLWAY